MTPFSRSRAILATPQATVIEVVLAPTLSHACLGPDSCPATRTLPPLLGNG
jgi:hypothetical protein